MTTNQLQLITPLVNNIEMINLTSTMISAAIIGQENRHLIKRNTDAGTMDIHALQTKINDHRTMINYLINNSINATFVVHAINNHHSETGPILTSWRDLIDLFFISFLIAYFTYFLLCRTGFSPCDKVL